MIIDTPEAARKFVWVLASDLWMYQKQEVIAALDRGTPLESLRDEIEERRLQYKIRVSPALFQLGTFDQMLVDALVKLRSGLRSS